LPNTIEDTKEDKKSESKTSGGSSCSANRRPLLSYELIFRFYSAEKKKKKIALLRKPFFDHDHRTF
jgi:hypothetical protein